MSRSPTLEPSARLLRHHRGWHLLSRSPPYAHLPRLRALRTLTPPPPRPTSPAAEPSEAGLPVPKPSARTPTSPLSRQASPTLELFTHRPPLTRSHPYDAEHKEKDDDDFEVDLEEGSEEDMLSNIPAHYFQLDGCKNVKSGGGIMSDALVITDVQHLSNYCDPKL
ncbi:hypothetical protein GUJ93_ZPchr0008g12355 [Zizania palustris]|uniref:Uncharacterized protein n=1 Tax=Zizania palustris TaxID=103762 RepID=A0A8J5RWI1_ZIZPA|nr:hypothetical protein GUJ93_ZPchr0008g12355 [Zizania palustris]